jgi:bifunctional non-homologous end joining protein LigD
VTPELLTPIEVSQAGRYVVDPAYAMQPKRDGHRIILSSCTTRRAFNKRGEPCAAPPALLRGLPPDVTVDGEWERSHFVIFDLLDFLGHDLRSLPYTERLAALLEAVKLRQMPFSGQFSTIHTWFTEKAKEENLLRGFQQRWEGVVFKRLDAPYAPGRAGQHFKLKFIKTCTVRVQNVEPTSARIEMLHSGGWIEVSGVSLIGRPKVQVGDFLEVKYLYATKQSGQPRLVQPVMIRKRGDVAENDCSTEQLVFKAEVI